MTAAATRATFSDFRIVKGRKVCQLVFELPIEAADEALKALGGLPQPATERWFGIARLTEEAVRKDDAKARYQQASEGEQAVTRAALLCEDPAFQEWCGVTTTGDAADRVRNYCGVTTRRAFVSDHLADTVDYAKVATLIRRELASHSFTLLERLAQHLSDCIEREFETTWIRLSVAKTAIVAGASQVGVVIETGPRPPMDRK